MKDLCESENYPNLFADLRWQTGIDTIDLKFVLKDDPPPDDLISNVNIVPFVGDQCIIIRLENGDWEIPGGTLEPEETYIQAVRRELLEEAGARLITFKVFGAWHCHSSMTRPYRDHLPHPDFYRVAGYGDAEIVGSPLNPDGGENVVAVEFLPVEIAASRFLENGRSDLAELYRLASTLRMKDRRH